jgi:hypothetical protein
LLLQQLQKPTSSELPTSKPTTLKPVTINPTTSKPFVIRAIDAVDSNTTLIIDDIRMKHIRGIVLISFIIPL